VGQGGFWDEQHRVFKLQDKKRVLRRLADSIPWESFRPLLERGSTQQLKGNAGRKRIDSLILFKMLVLQHLLHLSAAFRLRLKSLNSRQTTGEHLRNLSALV
jgi:transposase, IS5 family